MSTNTLHLNISKLQCAKCKKYLSNPPVYVEYSGDSVCEMCNEVMGKPYFRNLIYEELVKCSLFPCSYAPNGCPVLVQFSKTYIHESVCTYKHSTCPIELCGWAGRLDLLYNHFLSSNHSAKDLKTSYFILNKDEEMFKLVKVKKRTFVIWVNGTTDKINIEFINLDLGDCVRYTISIYKPNAKEEMELRKEGSTRLFRGKMREVVEYNKKLVCDILGDTDFLECSFQLVVH